MQTSVKILKPSYFLWMVSSPLSNKRWDVNRLRVSDHAIVMMQNPNGWEFFSHQNVDSILSQLPEGTQLSDIQPVMERYYEAMARMYENQGKVDQQLILLMNQKVIADMNEMRMFRNAGWANVQSYLKNPNRQGIIAKRPEYAENARVVKKVGANDYYF